MDNLINNKTKYPLSMSDIEARARVNKEKLRNFNGLTQHDINAGYVKSSLPRNLVSYKRQSFLSSLLMKLRGFLEGRDIEQIDSIASNTDTENV